MSTLLPGSPIRSLPEKSSGVVGNSLSNRESPSEVQLREYWRVLFKYRYIVAATTLFFLLLGVMYIFTVTPRYTASAQVRISTYKPLLAMTSLEDALKSNSDDANYLETQIQEIKSLSLADRVLQDDRIKEAIQESSRPGFFAGLFGAKVDALPEVDQVSGYSNPISFIKNYLSGINVRPIRKTSLVVVQATSTRPQIAAIMANKHASAYVDWVRDVRVKQQARGLQFLRSQSEELQARVLDLEHELADYAEANSIVALNKDENITVQRMAQLNELLTQTTADRIQNEKEYEEAQAGLNENSAAFDDVSVQNMKSELAKLEGEYAEFSAKFKPGYPKMKQLRSQIVGLKSAIQEQRGQILRGLRAKSAATVERENQLKEELEQQKSRAFELSKRQVQYNVLQRELASTRELLDNIERQSKETSLAVESNSSNVSIVDLAVTPTSSSYPRKKLTLFLMFLTGIGSGVCLAFLLNYLDNTLRTPEDLERVVQLPCLGVVPAFELEALGEVGSREGQKKLDDAVERIEVDSQTNPMAPTPAMDDSHPVVFMSDPKSLAAEAYRTIRTGILLSQAGEPPKTILVTSSQSAEGKTTMTLNLAASLSSAGARVALIDADLRRPRVGKQMGIESGAPGLVDVITGQRSITEVMNTSAMKRVSVIASGPIPPNPAELLGSIEMASIIDGLADVFDYVIIDSPPVLPVTDSVILSRFVDGVVMVVKGGITPRRVVLDARNRLESVGASILGVVLNDVDVTGGDYYYYNRYYYSYDQTTHYTDSNMRSRGV